MKAIAPTSVAALLCLASPAYAQHEPAPNPMIDYAGFADLVTAVGPIREGRRLSWDQFAAALDRDRAILLDTRSAADFAQGHIDGAINLPFSEFTQASLIRILGPDQGRPILIYCNNNFSDNVAPVTTKRAQLALNIPTFVNLYGYGYANVWELADVMSITDPRVPWVSGR